MTKVIIKVVDSCNVCPYLKTEAKPDPFYCSDAQMSVSYHTVVTGKIDPRCHLDNYKGKKEI